MVEISVTPREFDVYELFKQGLNRNQIMERLNLSYPRVEVILCNLVEVGALERVERGKYEIVPDVRLTVRRRKEVVLTDEDKEFIRQQHELHGVKVAQLARMFNAPYKRIWKICHPRT